MSYHDDVTRRMTGDEVDSFIKNLERTDIEHALTPVNPLPAIQLRPNLMSRDEPITRDDREPDTMDDLFSLDELSSATFLDVIDAYYDDSASPEAHGAVKTLMIDDDVYDEYIIDEYELDVRAPHTPSLGVAPARDLGVDDVLRQSYVTGSASESRGATPVSDEVRAPASRVSYRKLHRLDEHTADVITMESRLQRIIELERVEVALLLALMGLLTLALLMLMT